MRCRAMKDGGGRCRSNAAAGWLTCSAHKRVEWVCRQEVGDLGQHRDRLVKGLSDAILRLTNAQEAEDGHGYLGLAALWQMDRGAVRSVGDLVREKRYPEALGLTVGWSSERRDLISNSAWEALGVLAIMERSN